MRFMFVGLVKEILSVRFMFVCLVSTELKTHTDIISLTNQEGSFPSL